MHAYRWLRSQATASPRSDYRAKTLLQPLTAVASERSIAEDPRVIAIEAASIAEVVASNLARDVADRVRERASAKDVDVIVHCTCGGVKVHPDAFLVALHEVVVNAVQAARRGHPVVLDVRAHELERDVVWQVHDSGVGMSADVLTALGQSRASTWGRAGIGVALAGAIVARHGGSLRFESALGVGTTASIWLPGVHHDGG